MIKKRLEFPLLAVLVKTSVSPFQLLWCIGGCSLMSYVSLWKCLSESHDSHKAGENKADIIWVKTWLQH